MSELTDRLRGAQGAGSSAPKLNVVGYLDMGLTADGKPGFKFYNKEEKKNMFIIKPLTGIFIGHCLQMEAFDKDARSKGATWNTSYYFQNSDMITLFEPSGDKSKVKMKGTAEEVRAAFGGVKLQYKTKYNILLLTEKGLLMVSTNICLAIGDISPLQKEIADRMLILVPSVYDPESKEIAKSTHKALGPLAASNKPKYARMILGEQINEEKAMSWGILAVIDEFKAWREYKQKFGKVTDGEQPVQNQSIASPDLPMAEPGQTVAQAYQAVQPPQESSDITNDLPF